MKTFVFEPVGMDKFDPPTHTLKAGTVVKKVQPRGTPRNGTMGHCYVEPVEGGMFVLVLLNSLQPVKEGQS